MGHLAIDTETTGTDFHHGCLPFMITACDGKTNYIWEGEVNPHDRSEVVWDPSVIREVKETLGTYDHHVYHNAKFDVRALSKIGIKVDHWDSIDDTLIASHLACSGESHSLKYLAYKYLGYYNDGEHLLDTAVKAARSKYSTTYDIAKSGHKCFPGLSGPRVKWYKMDMWLAMKECRTYGSTDVEMTWLLWEMYKDVIDELDLWEQYNTRKALLEITYEMEETGLHLYRDGPEGVVNEIKRNTALKELLRQHIQKETKLLNHLDLNKESAMRLLFFKILNLPVYSRTAITREPSLNKEAIEHYIRMNPDNKVLQHYAEYRKCGTRIGYLSSYLKWCCSDSRIRSNILITGTRETRQASLNPNSQNIDKALRHIFGPPPGYVWLDFDLVNIELRIWTYEVGNKELIGVFEQGGSVHLLIASIIHRELFEGCDNDGESFKSEYEATWYQWVKNGNFAIIYGAAARKADITYKLEGAYSKIARRFPEVPVYTARTIKEAEDNDRLISAPQVVCVGGYPLDVDMNESFKACNYKIQGSAGYVINHAMINVHNNSDYQSANAKMVNQVHDSIIIEVATDDDTPQLRSSLQTSIEAAGLKYLPTCTATYKVIESAN